MQKDGQRNRRVIRFGVFEADLLARELRKRGVRVRLQEQPFRLLQALLERPGQIVTREEIKERLWPDDTFVDFDKSLNTSAQKLRRALGDSAETPRFVETVPRQGYRFLAPIGDPLDSAAAEPAEPVAAAPSNDYRLRRLLGYVAAALAAAVVLVGAWVASSVQGDPPRGPSRIVPITSLPGEETEPTFSPDGSQVAFSWNGPGQDNFDIYVTLVDGGGMARLTDDPAQDREPAWSPDGRTIAFLRGSLSGPGAVGIYTISPLGGTERPLLMLDRPIRFGPLSWSPDSKQLAYSNSGRGAEPGRIRSVSVETGAVQDLTSPSPGVSDEQAAFSPDGRSLAIARYEAVNGVGDILVIPLDGGEPKQPTSNLARTIVLRPTWTADGGEILFRTMTGGDRLWSVPASGGEEHLLTSVGEYAAAPAVSPNGKQLAYAQYAPPNADIWRVDIKPSQGDTVPERFTMSTRNDVWPNISPNGEKVAFSSTRSGSQEIWVADSDGSNAIKLTSIGGSRVYAPRFSPDGRTIAFTSTMRGQFDVYTIGVPTGSPVAITSGQGNSAEPSWSADGRWLYFHSDRSGAKEIWRAPAEGGPAEQMTTRGGDYVRASPDGEFLYFARRQGSGDLWRASLAGGQEALVLADQVATRGCWDVQRDGVYFVDFSEAERSGRWTIKRLNPDSGEVTHIASIAEAPSGTGCLSVSPDGSWLLYTQAAPQEADLMLLENFR